MKTIISRPERYQAYPVMDLPDRSWPDRVITQAPGWCSVDLRDGNQALSVPMNITQKMELFSLLVDMGFKEIEVGFPSASGTEFDFVRKLIKENRIPEDVTIQVLTPAREHLIERTFESLAGAKRAIVHLYNSTSSAQRRIVFGKTKPEITAIAVTAARQMRDLKARDKDAEIQFQYSPESFTGTEPEYAVEICAAVLEVWQPDAGNKVIINLPATVEMSTPNIYADRIEWFARRIKPREHIDISVHTHNDRGTAVAAAELAVMAGADRVEGALFGNGERTGNMDIVTMALNLFSQGVDPRLNISDINKVRDVYRRCTGMDVHPRHPYVGELVYTAFSGSHQDAINKGMKAQQGSGSGVWDVPYLPIDPRDVGRDYESIIRINSQSGKGGVAYVLEKDWGFQIPKPMQADFARVVQNKSEQVERELSSSEIRDCFEDHYLKNGISNCHIQTDNDQPDGTAVSGVIIKDGQKVKVEGRGNGPVDAFVRAVKLSGTADFKVCLYAEHALTQGADARAVSYIGLRTASGEDIFGVGIDQNIATASIKAVWSAASRLHS